MQMKKILVFLLTIFSYGYSYGQTIIAGWQAAASMPQTHPSTTNHANLETAVLSRGPALGYSNSSTFSYIATFPVNADKVAAKLSGAYFQATIQAKTGNYVTISAIDARLRRAAASSVDSYRWAYSLNGIDFIDVGPADVNYTSVTGNGDVQATIDLSNVEDLKYVPSSVQVIFRLYAWGATLANNASNFGFGKSTIGSVSSNTLFFSGSVVNVLPTFKVSFVSNGGNAIDDLFPTYNSTISAPQNPVRTGYTFAGWYKNVDLTSAWDFASDLVKEETKLYAKWTPISYTVSFNSNGGSSISPFVANYDSKVIAPSNPLKTGYGFAGWYKDIDLTNPWDFAIDLVKGDMTLFAKWNDPSQTIIFETIADKVYKDPPFTLNATSTSGLPITYEALTSNISINGASVTITGAGVAIIKATQAGDSFYNPATPVTQTFMINKAPQTITFEQVGPFSRYIGTVQLKATSSSNLPVTFTSNFSDVGTLTGSTLEVKGLGQVDITAIQEGNENYLPAMSVTRSITIHTASNLQLLVTQALSPNGDGINDYFLLDGIRSYPENQVKIINKNGVEVFNEKGYDNETVRFSGVGKGGDRLPSGTYYYLIEVNVKGQWVQKKGYLVLRY